MIRPFAANTARLLGAALAVLAIAVPARAQLIINPTYAANINSDPNATTIKNTIQTAINEYAARFSDNITVNITFQEKTTGLGSSSTALVELAYTDYRSALVSQATTANDVTALASLPIQANSPADGQPNMWIATANARALGFNVVPPSDSTISLNTSIMNFTRPPGNLTKFDLKAVAQHEIDEALGFGSGLNLPTGFPRESRPQDLFRYTAPHARSYTTSGSATSYFSIDDGVTLQLSFNQNGSADYGDWLSSATPHVQDAFGTAGATPDLNVELTNLDVIGYTLVTPVPEPSTLLLVAGALASGFRRFRRPRSMIRV